jgi:hypothetical protein
MFITPTLRIITHGHQLLNPRQPECLLVHTIFHGMFLKWKPFGNFLLELYLV